MSIAMNQFSELLDEFESTVHELARIGSSERAASEYTPKAYTALQMEYTERRDALLRTLQMVSQ